MDICVCIKRYPSLGSAIMLTDDGMAIDTDKLGFTSVSYTHLTLPTIYSV